MKAKLKLQKKIKSLGELKKIASRLRNKKKKVVFTNGCFDLLHYGHVKYLEEAKRKGDILIVGINSDSSVKRIKGKGRPIVNERSRSGVIAALESVDYVVLFKEDTPSKIIQFIRPDILVKGADYKKKDIVGREFISSYAGRVSRINFAKGYSTTHIIKKIAKIY